MERVLFVCLGNICRSPLAEGVLRHLVDERGLAGSIDVESAGTGAWHVGETPDPRSVEVAARHGVSLAGQFARKLSPMDYREFTRIFAMDAANLRELKSHAPTGAVARVCMLRDLDPEGRGDVPDPYYGGPEGFENVFAMVDRSCRALLDEISP